MSHLIDKKDLWSYIIKNSRHISSEELKALSKKGGGMKEATERLRVLSEDENLRLIEEAREKAWRDERARRAYSIKEGKKQGLQEGRKEGRQEGMKEGMKEGRKEGEREAQNRIVLNLLKENVALNVIEKTTGLTKEEIEKLKKDLNF